MAQGPFEQVGGLQKFLERPLEVMKAFHFSTFKDQACAFAVGADSLVRKQTQKNKSICSNKKAGHKGNILNYVNQKSSKT